MLDMVKKQIRELVETLVEAETEIREIIVRRDTQGLLNALADVQDAAVVIGSRVEEAEGLKEASFAEAGKSDRAQSIGREQTRNAAATIIALLEEYCECLWRITQAQEETQLRLTSEAWKLLRRAGREVEQLPRQLAAVFMPYKASMWDSMESVWQAACDDPDWVPFVVPMPYYDLKDGEMTTRHYEGELFPSYVPVLHYSDFPLMEMHPDAIFIHNPFDDCNTVTSVLPQFYSAELKKAAHRLIYIPYFITGDAVFMTHRYFPSYDNVDFIVTQCEKTIASFSADLPRSRFLPYGSPIADRVLRLEKEKPSIPEEWKPQLRNGRDFGNDRTVMLNTSITRLLGQKERFLDKIEYLFDTVKGKKGITLIWRPHPLLFATAQTMGEKYVHRLTYLEEKFLHERIGVLDKTPDVGVTVALCDAYLGEKASSVIHMFGIAGKPRFYVDVRIPEIFCAANGEGGGREDGIWASAWCGREEREYYVLDRSGWIVEKDCRTGKYIPLVRIPGSENVWGRAYRSMEMVGESLWVYPENAEGIFSYRIGDGRMRKVFRPQALREDSLKDAERKELQDIDEECLAVIRAEKFRRGNRNHEWYEGENCTLDDYFSFLQTAEVKELAGTRGAYAAWLANLDGSCGRKVLCTVKESCLK